MIKKVRRGQAAMNEFMSITFDTWEGPVAENLEELKGKIPEGVKLVAVTKTHPPEVVMKAYDSGHKVLGENKVQELVAKKEQLPEDIEWHMIGHMQTNKVKYCAPFVYMIHSVDRLKVLNAIEKEARKNNRVIRCLLQIHIAEEESKFGLSAEEAFALLDSEAYAQMQHVRICGLMGMATFTQDKKQVRKEFIYLKKLFEEIKNKYFPASDFFKELSMGMSGDWEIALEEGATILRIGSLIFGSRNYNET